MRRTATALALGLALCVAAPASAATFRPVADSHVSSASPGSNYGSATTVKVDGSPVIRTYLRFGVEGLSQPVKRATVRLYSFSSTGTGVTAHGVPDTGWGEHSLTYSNAPAFGAATANSNSGSFAAVVSIDVTPLVTGNGAVSIALNTTSTSSKSFASREDAAQSPVLLVETEEPPLPPPGGEDPLIAAAGDIACDPADPNYNGWAWDCGRVPAAGGVRPAPRG